MMKIKLLRSAVILLAISLSTPVLAQAFDCSPAVRKIIVKYLRVHEAQVIPSAKIMADLKADELDLVAVTMALETEFNMVIDDKTASGFVTVSDLNKYVNSKAGNTANCR